MALFDFDATAIEPSQTSFEPVPAGVYVAKAIETDLRELKSGNGTGLSVQFEIIDGQFINRRIFSNLNVKHNNQTAERIGQEQLSAFCKAVGINKLKNTDDLVNKPLKIKVKIRKDESGNYGDRNEITGYEAISGAVPSASHSAPPKAPAASAPWANARA